MATMPRSGPRTSLNVVEVVDYRSPDVSSSLLVLAPLQPCSPGNMAAHRDRRKVYKASARASEDVAKGIYHTLDSGSERYTMLLIEASVLLSDSTTQEIGPAQQKAGQEPSPEAAVARDPKAVLVADAAIRAGRESTDYTKLQGTLHSSSKGEVRLHPLLWMRSLAIRPMVLNPDRQSWA